MKKELTDQELVKKVLEGDAQIFGIIISNTQSLVIHITYKMIKHPEDRKDLLQEVYLKVFDNLGSFKFNAKLSTWIGTITYNTCLKYLGKKKIPILNLVNEKEKDSWESIEHQFVEQSNNHTDLYILQKERAQVLALEIEKLPPLYRTIISLYHHQELSYKEIMTITGLSEGTLKSYLYRARKQLKINLLKNYSKEDL